MEVAQLHIRVKICLAFHRIFRFLYLPFSPYNLLLNCSRCNHPKFFVLLNRLSILGLQSRLHHSQSKVARLCYRALFKCRCKCCNNPKFLHLMYITNNHNKIAFHIHSNCYSNSNSNSNKKVKEHPSRNKILQCRYSISSVPQKLFSPYWVTGINFASF